MPDKAVYGGAAANSNITVNPVPAAESVPTIDEQRHRDLCHLDHAQYAVWETSYVKGLEQRCEDLEAALQQAYQCCARPAGVCFDPTLIDGRDDAPQA